MRIRLLATICFGVATTLLAHPAVAQPEQSVGLVDDPCGPPLAPPPMVEEITEALLTPQKISPAMVARFMADPALAAYSKDSKRRAERDWPNLCRYAVDNRRLQQAGDRVKAVFYGDSGTENWVKGDPGLFTQGIVGRGIGGQTSAQMVLRFHADVIALKPEIVHIIAGTNDIAGNTGPTTVQAYRNNIAAMAEMARVHGIRVVIGSVPPASRFFWQPAIDPRAQIVELNRWLEAYARDNGLVYVNYYAALVAPDGGILPTFSNDGVHPNRAGYAAIRRLAQEALDQSLGARAR